MGKRSDALSAQLHAANRQLQAELRRTKEMETMRQQFLFAVSHELKTPLAIIQGYAEGWKVLRLMRKRNAGIAGLFKAKRGKWEFL